MQVTVLSPHRDDAAFSCGLLLQSLLCVGCDVTIVNVFTVSRYAPYLAHMNNDRALHVTAARRDEDAAFAETLLQHTGPNRGQLSFLDLDWQDVPLRWLIDDDRSLEEAGLPPEELDSLRREFQALPAADVVLAPMALGGHIDHRLVVQAASSVFRPSALAFYEDLPYACRMPDTKRHGETRAGDGVMREAWLPTGQGAPGLKQQHALCYGSQIAPSVAAEMETYAREHAYRERFVGEEDALDALRNAFVGREIAA